MLNTNQIKLWIKGVAMDYMLNNGLTIATSELDEFVRGQFTDVDSDLIGESIQKAVADVQLQ